MNRDTALVLGVIAACAFYFAIGYAIYRITPVCGPGSDGFRLGNVLIYGC